VNTSEKRWPHSTPKNTNWAPRHGAIRMSPPRPTPLSSITVILFANRGLDRRQYVERGRRLVELTSAMVGNNDPVAADLSGTQCISRIRNPFDDQGARELPPIVL